MKNVLVTGGTVFVSRDVAEYFINKGYNDVILFLFLLIRNKKNSRRSFYSLNLPIISVITNTITEVTAIVPPAALFR